MDQRIVPLPPAVPVVVPNIVPGIPPPPLPPTLSTKSQTRHDEVGKTFEQLQPRAEVRKLCLDVIQRRHLREKQVMIYSYNQVASVLQDGPMCGFVALEMAIQLTTGKHFSAQELFTKAKDFKYTSAGEMFSVDNLGLLASDVCGVQADVKVTDCCNIRDMLMHLSMGLPILVPYDKDANMQPCLKRGTKAHWAVVTGFAVILDGPDIDLEKFDQDEDLSFLFHLKTGLCDWNETLNKLNIENTCNIFVFAKQGKSKYTGLWPLKDLLESNNNLEEIDPKVKMEINQPVVPPGGLVQGLKNKILFLQKDKS